MRTLFNRWAPIVGGLIAALYGLANVPAPNPEELDKFATALVVVVSFVVQVWGVLRKVVARFRKNGGPPENLGGKIAAVILAGFAIAIVVAGARATTAHDFRHEPCLGLLALDGEKERPPCWACHEPVPAPCSRCHHGPNPTPEDYFAF